VADDTVHPIDREIYNSLAPRVAACGFRHEHGTCTVLWIKTGDHGWVLLPHGMPDLAVHLSTHELVTMLDRLRDNL
jgi:hypothetical protein